MARRTPKLDFQKREIDIPTAGVYAMTSVAPALIPGLALIGLKHTLLNAQDPNEAFDGLRNGVMPKVREASTAKTDPWVEAMALACAEERAALDLGPKAKPSAIQQAAAGHLEAMREHVASLSKETQKVLRSQQAVIQHHRRLTNVTPDQLSLLAIAGVLPLTGGAEIARLPDAVPLTTGMEAVI